MNRPQDEVDPDTNREQRDEGQAQDVATEARRRGTDRSEDSEHGGKENPAAITPDDVPDVVDKMNEMIASGRIDNDAYAGEPMHDDEEDQLGETDQDDEE